ncbi:MAG: biotin--[acetyl-CoA-carboxylase] ligase, partial [Victivallales bacterium]|nr:biotin--[acetyl-CoA-carboxylase] ligase [Victivallales bacterium]
MPEKLNIIYLETVDSTNKYALRNFQELPDASLVVASGQSAGRGRRGRHWLSPPGTDIYASLLIKDINTARHAPRAAMAVALGVLATLRHTAPGLKFWLKWPNDVFCRDRKIAGILCEGVTGGDNRIGGIVAGMGININMPANIIAEIPQPATSLKHETGQEFSLKKLIKELAKNLNKYYSIDSISPEILFTSWKDENLLNGQKV